MPERMRESITTNFADVCIRVPKAEVNRVRSAFSQFLDLAGVQYSITDNDDEGMVTWEEAFPELGAGSVLQGARDREELTQAELADKIGVSRQTIISLEQGRFIPSLPTAFKIAKAFGVSIEEIFELEGEDKS